MIFHIRDIKHKLRDMDSQSQLIKNLKTNSQMMNKIWQALISEEKNRDAVIEAFKSLKCNSADTLLVQSYLKYLLKNFDELCRKNNIP